MKIMAIYTELNLYDTWLHYDADIINLFHNNTTYQLFNINLSIYIPAHYLAARRRRNETKFPSLK